MKQTSDLSRSLTLGEESQNRTLPCALRPVSVTPPREGPPPPLSQGGLQEAVCLWGP